MMVELVAETAGQKCGYCDEEIKEGDKYSVLPTVTGKVRPLCRFIATAFSGA